MPTATVTQGRSTQAPARRAGSLLLVLIAVCTAVTAANIYLAAPLLPLIARDYGSTPSAVAWVASVAQFGYAAGLLVFAPLGDSVNRRRLVAVLSLVTAAALAAGAASAGTTALAAAVLVASAATVVPHLLAPLVAPRPRAPSAPPRCPLAAPPPPGAPAMSRPSSPACSPASWRPGYSAA